MTTTMKDMRGAAGYCDHGPKDWQLSDSGTLANYRLAVKDLYHVKGHVNHAGNPDWAATHAPAEKTADVLSKLMAAGTCFTGFTHTDELAYSLEGNNSHYGRSENPKLPGHACGGSSMGSAAAVASAWADIGLGTDTGGSVRVPASYCGLFGMRPSHGAIPVDGLIGLAPRFDTVGWFAKDPELLAKVGNVLLPEQQYKTTKTLLVDEALIELVEPSLRPAIDNALKRLAPQFSTVMNIDLGLRHSFRHLEDVFRILQGRAIVNYHGDWIKTYSPKLSNPVEQRMQMAFAITNDEVRDAEFLRQGFVQSLTDQLPENATLFLPTTPTTAPKLGEDTSALRPRLLKLTAIAGLSGSAQIHLPLLPQTDGHRISKPYGFSLLQPPGSDRGLIKLVEKVTKRWNEGVSNER